MRDGHLYIDYFYSEPQKMDGPQKRWHSNHALARDGLYEDGGRIYNIFYNTEGEVIEQDKD